MAFVLQILKMANLQVAACQFVWLFGIIGMFVLLLACINFMNLIILHAVKSVQKK